MRFLQAMLSVIWLMFGWLCYSAVQWQEPMKAPWHVIQPLEQLTQEAGKMGMDAEELLDRDIKEYSSHIQKYKEAYRADLNATLGRCYWLKAYLKDRYVLQKSYLQLAINHMMFALQYYSEQEYSSDRRINAIIAQYNYNVADLFHQLREYETAEAYYLEAMRRLPGQPTYFHRYSELIEESGLPQKIEYDDYFQRRRGGRRSREPLPQSEN